MTLNQSAVVQSGVLEVLLDVYGEENWKITAAK